MANAKALLLECPLDEKCSRRSSVGEVETDVCVALITNKAVTRKQLIPIFTAFLSSQK